MQTDFITLDQASTLGSMFAERVRRSPDKPAYRYFDPETETWRELTWRMTWDEVQLWISGFRSEGLNQGDRVAILLKNCHQWALFDLAAQLMGLVVVPLYTNDRPDNIHHILTDAEASLLLIEHEEQWSLLRSGLTNHPHLNRIISLQRFEDPETDRLLDLTSWLSIGKDHHADSDLPDIDPDQLATVVYTSGTTGRPKGVMLSHRNILWNINQGLASIPVYPDDLLLSFLPLSHTLERTVGHFMPIVAGASVAYARSIPQLGEDLMHIQPSILIAVPRIFERVHARILETLASASGLKRWLFNSAIRAGWLDFEHQQGRSGWQTSLLFAPLLNRLVGSKIQQRFGGRLRFAVSGGAPLSDELSQFFIGLGVRILQGYGLTETSPIIAANSIERNKPASVGVPLPGIEYRIESNGELLTRSPSVMLGYWRQPEATAAMIDSSGWLHTGDQARLEGDHLYITGRTKDILVLSNGEKVPPGDMEWCICKDELIDQALVVGEARPFLSVLLFMRDGFMDALPFDSPTASELESWLINRINQLLHDFPGYAVIRRVLVLEEQCTVENGLLTPTLKTRRNAVLDLYADEIDALYVTSAPTSRG